MSTPDETPRADQANETPASHDSEASKPQEASAGDELREGISLLFSAARKVIRQAEPHIVRGLSRAEEALSKLGNESESLAGGMGREVTAIASRLASRLKAAATDATAPDDARADHVRVEDAQVEDKPEAAKSEPGKAPGDAVEGARKDDPNHNG